MLDDWQPACSLDQLRARARLLQDIRRFFAERSVLEVETPVLSHSSGTDPHLEFFTTEFSFSPQRQTLYLQTSPEFAMKRLLASGSGSIFQICKAFRNAETGRFHNPEFTLLEWYRVGYSLPRLMDEIAELMAFLFKNRLSNLEARRISYAEIFKQQTGLNPLLFSHHDYRAYAVNNQLPEADRLCGHDHALWLDMLFSHKIQPKLAKNILWMVHGYPVCLSSLAKINKQNEKITDRVEIFINGVELGNGYFELNDANEQEQRFDDEIKRRQAEKRAPAIKDRRLIAALKTGLPECAGMAIGLDRLLMLLSEKPHLCDVLAFPVDRA